MKSIVLCLLMSFSFPLLSFSQQKKAEKYLRKEKYQEALSAVKKTRSSPENKESLMEIQLKSYYGLYRQSKKMYNLDKSLYYSLQLIKVNPVHTYDPVVKEIQAEVERLSEEYYLKGDTKRAKYYTSTLASAFKDTIHLYEKLFPAIVKSESDGKKSEIAASIVSGNMTKPRLSPRRSSIIKFSENFVGKPYKWGGEDSSGFDCSGFVLYVWRNFGYNFNHSAKDQSELGRDVSRDSLRSGDLVFFGKQYPTGKYKIDHVAMIYSATPDQLVVIHSTNRGVNVQEIKEGDYWSKKLLFYRNIMD